MLADLRDPDFLTGEHRTQIHFAFLVADATAGGDDRGPVVKRIFQFSEASIEPRGPRVVVRGHAHPKRLVGPLVVIARHKRIEASLLLQEVGRGGLEGFAFERQMHAFVPAVLLRVPGLDPLEVNPQAQPPDREAR